MLVSVESLPAFLKGLFMPKQVVGKKLTNLSLREVIIFASMGVAAITRDQLSSRELRCLRLQTRVVRACSTKDVRDK